MVSVVFQLINCMWENKAKVPKEKKTILPQESVQFLQSEENEKKTEQKESLHFLPTVPLCVSYVLAIEPVRNDYVQQYVMRAPSWACSS